MTVFTNSVTKTVCSSTQTQYQQHTNSSFTEVIQPLR